MQPEVIDIDLNEDAAPVTDEDIAYAENELVEDIQHHLSWTARHRPGRDAQFAMHLAGILTNAVHELTQMGAFETSAEAANG